MRERLREVAQQPPRLRVVLLRDQADVVAQSQQPLEQFLRLRVAAEQTDGWLYLVTLTGTTGARQDVSPALEALVERARAVAGVPLYAGFGISTPAHARSVADVADGVVVGSRAVEVAQDGPRALQRYVRSLRDALDSL